MKLEFGFGTGVQTVEVPEKNLMGVLMSNDVCYRSFRCQTRLPGLDQ